MTVRRLSLIVAGAVLVALICWFVGDESGDRNEGKPSRTREKAKKSRLISRKGESSVARSAMDSAWVTLTNRSGKAVRRLKAQPNRDIESTFVFDNGKPWPKDQVELCRNILEAQDLEDVDALRDLSSFVLKCKNPEVRERMVDALGWCGEKTLAELTAFLSDKDENVADAAVTQWKMSLQEIEDEASKASVINLALQGIRDHDLLEDVLSELVGMDDLLSIQTLADAIEGENERLSSLAKETYKFITDEEWSGLDSAEAWLQENYSPELTENHGACEDGAERSLSETDDAAVPQEELAP